MPSIYTKTGDNGDTGLFDGSRVLKNDLYINTLGDIDELNSYIGAIISSSRYCDIDEIKILNKVQNWLFDIGTLIATPNKCNIDDIVFDIDNCYTKQLEKLIDNMTIKLPKLTKFILPGGNLEISNIHIARSVCRRAERNVVCVANNNLFIKKNCIKFINRLSDYLFTLARYIGKLSGTDEVIYVKNTV